MGRGKAYSAAENLALCRAWIMVSQSSLTGADQKEAVFWDSVRIAFIAQQPALIEEGLWTHRSRSSTQNRFGTISHDVQKFASSFTFVEGKYSTGVLRETDKIKMATAIYNKMDVANLYDVGIGKEPCGDAFEFEHRWQELRKCPKFAGSGSRGVPRDHLQSEEIRVRGEDSSAANQIFAETSSNGERHPDSTIGSSPCPDLVRDNSTEKKGSNSFSRGGTLGKKFTLAKLQDEKYRLSIAKELTKMRKNAEERTSALKEANLLALFSLPHMIETLEAKLFFSNLAKQFMKKD
jgi:hypothetical protein